MRPLVVGIGGGSGAGKTTLARELAMRLGRDGDPALVVELDWYYRDLSHLGRAERAEHNFDHPSALDWTLLRAHLEELRRGGRVERPVYDFVTHTRFPGSIPVQATRVTIVEGVLALHDAAVCELFDLRVFVAAPFERRLERRLSRDIQERGRTAESVRRQFRRTVEPMHQCFVEPSRLAADLTVGPTALLEETVRAIVARLQR